MHIRSEEQETVRSKVYRLVEQTIDIAVTFDDRLYFSPLADEGTWQITFTSDAREASLLVEANVNEQAEVFIVLTPTVASGRPKSEDVTGQDNEGNESKQDTTAYFGTFQSSEIHQQLGTSIARWYGHVIRT